MDQTLIVDAFKKEFEAIRNITSNTYNMQTRFLRLPVIDRISEMYPAADEEAAKDAISFHGHDIVKRIIEKIKTSLLDVDSELKLTVVSTAEKEGQALFLIQGYPVGLFHAFAYEGPRDTDGRATWRTSFVFDPNGKAFK